MKLLIVTDGITPFVVGGMQKHSANLTRELVRLGHEVTLLHCVPHGAELPNRAAVVQALQLDEHCTLKTICISFPKPGLFPGHYLKESFIYSQRCYRAISSELTSYDFIYTKGFSAWYFIQEKLKGVAMPKVGVKFHGYEMFQPPVNIKMRLQNWLLQSPVKWINQRADVIFSYGGKISKLIADLGVDQSRIIDIPTGIDPSWIQSSPMPKTSNPRRFLFIGRYERRKGIEELHAVLPEIIAQTDAQFDFIGPIPHSKRIKHAQVTYHGQLTNAKEIRDIIDSCDVLLVPSYSEGMPNVIMEGMARGLAIVATDVGAVAAVVDSSNGILMSRCNPIELKEAIIRVGQLGEPELKALKSRSIEKIQSFTWDKIAARTIKEIGAIRA